MGVFIFISYLLMNQIKNFVHPKRASLIAIGINAAFLSGTNSFVAKRILSMALFIMFTCLTYGMLNLIFISQMKVMIDILIRYILYD